MPAPSSLHIAVVGGGIAGASCAHALSQAGHSVRLFDKSRGPGGRLATRRVAWVDPQGQAQVTWLDHGAVGITASTEPFRLFLEQAQQSGWLQPWPAQLARGGVPLDADTRIFLPVPGMPALCQHLLQGIATHWLFEVQHLQRDGQGWRVQDAQGQHPERFDAVVLALPPAQAAPLLAPHQIDWAGWASSVPMQPCWTLMGVADESKPNTDPDQGPSTTWDLARPWAGPLACALRSDARPGRERRPGQAHWVLHARADWSQRHLEQPAAWVQAQLQAALERELGQPVHWLHSVVHRWRYAMLAQSLPAPASGCWWDAAQGLGVCGDFLGGSGAEGAWLSAQALVRALLEPASAADPAVASEGMPPSQWPGLFGEPPRPGD